MAISTQVSDVSSSHVIYNAHINCDELPGTISTSLEFVDAITRENATVVYVPSNVTEASNM